LKLPIISTVAVLALIVAVRTYSQSSAPAAPRTRDGRISLGPPPGQSGLWMPPNAGDERLVDLDSATPAASNQFGIDTNPLLRNPRLGGISPEAAAQLVGKLTVNQVPFQPWAKALYAFRSENPYEPHTRCKPSGGPRQFMTPYGVEFLDAPELQRMFIVDIGGPHTMRVVYMDGKGHPKNLSPSYLGHSIGQWDHDTLVIDSIGFNERFWIDRQGLPHTDKLHLVERITRADLNTLLYEVTIDDPGAYSSTWSTGVVLRWTPGQELFEYVCQDNNHAPELMIGAEKLMGSSTSVVP